ncbi:Transcriptional regulator, contains XRE-family HTH domain [Lachnospiraceae bacterium]|nr:Transcriptional regulator, contains XRE-family HTH domain [Lachnospiraceae bacterium]
MTISDRVFYRLKEIGMPQREFSEKTGIAQSTISEWKSKRTNPTSEKIMIICKVLDVTPEWLLSGVENTGNKGNKLNLILVDRNTEVGEVLTTYNKLDENSRARLMGYMTALNEAIKNKK